MGWPKRSTKVKTVKGEPPWYEDDGHKQNLITMGYLPDIKETVLEVVTREVWQARPPVEEKFLKRRAANVFYTLTYTPLCKRLLHCCRDMRKMQNKAIDEDKDVDIAANFLIGYDGRVYEGRGWGVAPRLPKPYTKKATTSILISFIAPSDSECDLPMYDAKFDLVEWGEHFKYINPNYMIFEPRNDYVNEGNEFFKEYYGL
ncbi:peptidoglycan recognition protein 4-like [Macrosteles quadrilineatus]|uniref:peptidoglycan recognition protein 4-like n=1 Tax=Macrosteles quadrilineatus TaxID=74068 RepID=UPI0023E1114E|nr:peptidoglycan recognition protein 4-like [Macrosteles quadrilineatus]